MKQWRMIALILLMTIVLPQPKASAQLPLIDIIKGAVKKVIKAIDLNIQRQQNKVIWLQNAQKVLENEMSKLKLDQISDWTQKQKEIYKDYFEELKKVKSIISYYQRIRDITSKQARLVNEYSRAWTLIRSDKHFSVKEIEYMGSVYQGILDETANGIDQLLIVVSSFQTQMTDAKRLEIINATANHIDKNYDDLKRFNTENAMLSLQRSASSDEIRLMKRMYGIK